MLSEQAHQGSADVAATITGKASQNQQTPIQHETQNKLLLETPLQENVPIILTTTDNMLSPILNHLAEEGQIGTTDQENLSCLSTQESIKGDTQNIPIAGACVLKTENSSNSSESHEKKVTEKHIPTTMGQTKGDRWSNERDAVRNCLIYQYKYKELVQAGELAYINEKLQNIVEQLVFTLKPSVDRAENFPLFVHKCLTPVLYLLKREQNLTNFVRPIKQLLAHKKYHAVPRISLRLLVDVLLENSDSVLRRILMRLLSKRNPVPMLEPALERIYRPRFVPELLHVWNYSRPTVLSLGIGPCKGKSSLLNSLFLTHFEQSLGSFYFDSMIDIDFGYHFIPPGRALNIADCHGQCAADVLKHYVSLFNGFLIHVEASSLLNDSNLSNLSEFMNIFPIYSYKIVLIRDVPGDELPDDDDEPDHVYSRYFPSSTVYLLPHVGDKTTDENIDRINKLRMKVLREIEGHPGIYLSKKQVQNEIKRLMNQKQIKSLEDTHSFVDTVKSTLVEATKSDYPAYEIFADISRYRSRMSKVDFYGIDENPTKNQSPSVKDEPMSMFHLQEKLIKLEKKMHSMTQFGVAFDSFIRILQDPQERLTKLDLLSVELKRQRDRTLSAGQLAADLPFDKCHAIELHWRNAIICSKIQLASRQLVNDAYGDFVENGKPFEIIDGDNFCFQADFLEQVFDRFTGKRIFILSVIGPQNSGKSTLFNYMFGTLFDVRDGRCTRGNLGC